MQCTELSNIEKLVQLGIWLTKAIHSMKGLSSYVSGERACNDHSTYVDSDILKKAQTSNEQDSAGMFVPGFMATYRHTKPLSAAPKAPEGIINRQNNRKHKNTRVDQG